MKKTNNKKGFTLAELLVVVAIIAVLVAIAIPIFTSQLEKAREATDAANLRAAYATAAANQISSQNDNGTISTSDTTVTITQTKEGWDSVDEIAGVTLKGSSINAVTAGDKVTVKVDADGTAKFTVEKKSTTN